MAHQIKNMTYWNKESIKSKSQRYWCPKSSCYLFNNGLRWPVYWPPGDNINGRIIFSFIEKNAMNFTSHFKTRRVLLIPGIMQEQILMMTATGEKRTEKIFIFKCFGKFPSLSKNADEQQWVNTGILTKGKSIILTLLVLISWSVLLFGGLRNGKIWIPSK